MTIPIARLDPRKKGLERWFGPLEAEIMTLFWGRGAALMIQEVLDALNTQRPVAAHYAYTTVSITVNRLHTRHGVLCRERAQRHRYAHEYTPTCTQREYEQIQTRAALAALEQVSV